MAEEDTDQDVESTDVEGEETAEAAVEENDKFANEEGDNETTDKANGEPASLDLILDIPLTVTVELGRSKMLINDLLQLGQGSVIELTKLVG